MSEDQLQAQCYQYFHNTYPSLRKTLFAVPNGGTRNKIEATKFKATGLVKGVHDLIFFHNQSLYTFELKVGKNKLSDDQIHFSKQIEKQGGISYVVRDFETFKNILDDIIRL